MNARGLFQHLPSSWDWYSQNFGPLAHFVMTPSGRIQPTSTFGRTFVSSPRKNGKNSFYELVRGAFSVELKHMRLTVTVMNWLIRDPQPEPIRIAKINHLWKGAPMQQEFTDEQIIDALTKTAQLMGDIDISGDGDDATVIGPAYWDRDEIEAVRTIVALLTDENDGWEECELADIKPGDHIKIIDHTTSFTAELTYSEPVLNVDFDFHRIEFGGDVGWRSFTSETRFFRLPAKHPNPEVHEFIRDDEFHAGQIMRATQKGTYMDEHGNHWPATDFTNWTPMKMMEDN